MKNRSYANRGGTLEAFIKYANAGYRKDRIAFIEKQSTEFIPLRDGYGKVYSVKVERKATFDFLGRYKQYPIAIEAKNTNTDSIRIDAVQPNQADDLDAFTDETGTIGLVLVSFNLERFFAVPWAFWGEAYDLRVRRGDTTSAANIHAFGQEWDVPKKKSIRAEELNPAWEVSSRGNPYGLDYLRDAELYITKPETQQKQI